MDIDLDNIVGNFIKTGVESTGIVKSVEYNKSLGTMVWFFRFKDGRKVWCNPAEITLVEKPRNISTITEKIFRNGQLI